jgi:hypothetical protein
MFRRKSKYKKLLQRVRDLEDYLGVIYDAGENGPYDYSSHVTNEHGRMRDFEVVRKKHFKKRYESDCC